MDELKRELMTGKVKYCQSRMEALMKKISQPQTTKAVNQIQKKKKPVNEIQKKKAANWNRTKTTKKMQGILSIIDKGYTSAAKCLLFGIVRNHNIDAVHSSSIGTPGIFEKAFSMLTSESFLRAIENGDMKTATEFLKNSWTFHARRYEASCIQLSDRKFLLNIYNNLSFAERAIEFAAKSRNAKAFSLITSALFLKAVKTGDRYSVKRFLNGSRNELSMRFEALCIKSFDRKFIVNVNAFDMDCLLRCCISYSDWLEGIAISPCRMLLELVKFEKIVDEVTKNGWTALHLVLSQLQSHFEKKERTILIHLLKFRNFNANSLTDELETVLHFTCRCSVSNEQFTLFVKELLKHRVNVNQRNSSGQSALMIACKTGNIAAVREILKWKDYYGQRANIGARDENGQTALSFAKQLNNAKIVEIIEQNLFLRAVESGDTETVKTYMTPEESNFEVLYRRAETDRPILNDHHEHNSEQMEIQSNEDDVIKKYPRMRLKTEIKARFTSKDSMTHSLWLEAVAVAQNNLLYEMLKLLFNDDRFIHRFNEDGQTILHQVVAEYLGAEYDSRKLKTIEILLKSAKFSANVLNLQNETIFEIVCKIKPKHCNQIDYLLRCLLKNGVELNGRNKNSETFLMLACENERIDIVCSLLKLDSHKFDLAIDAVDNSGETALMKAKQNSDSKIVAALLGKKLISAVVDEKEDAMLNDHFLLGFNVNELTTFYEVVAEYLGVNMFSGKMNTIEILLKLAKLSAQILNLQNEITFEIICKIDPRYYCNIDGLLQILLQKGLI